MAKDDFLKGLMSWIGTPFGLEGHKKGVNTNCSRFVLDSLEQSTTNVQALNTFSQLLQIRNSSVNAETIDYIISQLRTICTTITVDEMDAGDVILIVVTSRLRSILALAVAINSREIIYCHSHQGVIIGQLTKSMLSNIKECFRFLIWENT